MTRDTRQKSAAFATMMLCLAILPACTSTEAYKTATTLENRSQQVRVLLMPPDIEISEKSVSGMLEPKAAWTEIARRNVDLALETLMKERNCDFVRYGPPGEDIEIQPEHVQLYKRHQAVGGAILMHKYLDALALPTKSNRFDWSLGTEAQTLGESFDADYALFVYFRDTLSSPGRTAAIIATALLIGGPAIGGGEQVGFASLVDLRTGNVVWFNVLASSVGDLREPDQSLDACTGVLTDLPL